MESKQSQSSSTQATPQTAPQTAPQVVSKPDPSPPFILPSRFVLAPGFTHPLVPSMESKQSQSSATQTTPKTISQTTPKTIPLITPQTTPQTTHQTTHQTTSQTAPRVVSNPDPSESFIIPSGPSFILPSVLPSKGNIEQWLPLFRAFCYFKAMKEDCLPIDLGNGLFIGGIGAAYNKNNLLKAKITHILTVASGMRIYTTLTLPCCAARSPSFSMYLKKLVCLYVYVWFSHGMTSSSLTFMNVDVYTHTHTYIHTHHSRRY